MNSQISQEILDGKHDEHLDEIIRAAQARGKRVIRAELDYGQMVWFNENSNPRYLKGVQGKVQRVNRETVTLDISGEADAGRFTGARNLRVPMNWISTTEIERD